MSDETTMTMSVPDRKGGHIETVPFTAADLKRVTDQLRKESGKPPMKPDPEFDKMKDNTYRVTAEQLRQFIERFEQLDLEKKGIADQQKAVMAEAKARGYDTKVMRKVIARRKRDADEIAEEEAVFEMYREALGMV